MEKIRHLEKATVVVAMKAAVMVGRRAIMER